MDFQIPGRILCATVNTPDLDGSLADYRDLLGLRVVEAGQVSPGLARQWGAPAQVARRYALLRAPAGAGGFVRLVEGTAVPQYRPLRTWGWAAFELTVADSFALHEKLRDGPFIVLGPPKRVPGFDTFVPFQVQGRAGEVLYLNTVLQPAIGALDLPVATAPVDHVFIAVLAAENRETAVAFHTGVLGFSEGETWTFPYSMINQSFGLSPDDTTTITMTRTGRVPASEIDQYPPAADPRPRSPGELPPGNASVTFAVRSLDDVKAPFVEPPMAIDGPLYAARRAASLWGPSGELIEMVEM